MSADRVAAEWPRRRGKMRERAEAGSSRPVIFKHVKSDTVTVEMFFFPPLPRNWRRKIVGSHTYWCLTENQLVRVVRVLTCLHNLTSAKCRVGGKQKKFHSVKVSPEDMLLITVTPLLAAFWILMRYFEPLTNFI